MLTTLHRIAAVDGAAIGVIAIELFRGAARAGLAGLSDGAGIAIVTGFSICNVGIGAHSGGGIAHTGVVALIRSFAFDGICAATRACRACIGLRAGIAVVASGSIR